MSVYLDYNASAPLYPSVKEGVLKVFEQTGNPSSVHHSGRACKAMLNEARQICSDFFGVRLDKVVFTSGATEANAQVIETFKQKGAHICASMIEHDAVRAPLTGYDNLYQIGVLESGVIDLNELDSALSKLPHDVVKLICCMFVNNETGVIQPIEDVVALARKYNAYVLCDAVQAIGRIRFDFSDLGVDYLTLSAHKIGGLKGVGALILGENAIINAFISGGGQERGLRSGTENLAGIVSLGIALNEMAKSLEDQPRLLKMRDALEAKLQKVFKALKVAGASANRVATTSTFILPGVKGETQVMALDLEGFAVSVGSACSSGKIKTSHVLRNMGYDILEASSSLRVSFGFQTTEKDLETFSDTYINVMGRLLKNKE